MRIRVSKKHLNNLLIFGIINLIIGIGNIILDSDRIIIYTIWMFSGIIMLLEYLNQKINDYIIIIDKTLLINNLINKKIILLSVAHNLIVHKNKVEIQLAGSTKYYIMTWFIDKENKQQFIEKVEDLIRNNKFE
jgi:hypothetical protein